MAKSSTSKSSGKLAATNLNPATVAALDLFAARAAAIDTAHLLFQQNTLPDRPEGYFTALEYASQYNLPEDTARGRLYALTRNGKLHKVLAYFPTPSGAFRAQVVYGIVK